MFLIENCVSNSNISKLKKEEIGWRSFSMTTWRFVNSFIRSTSISRVSSWIQTSAGGRGRGMRRMKKGKWGISVTRHIDRVDSLLFIASAKRFSSFRSYAPLQRTDEHEELIRDVSQRTGQPARKKKKKSETVTIFMNRRTADKDSCTSWHCSDFSSGIIKTRKIVWPNIDCWNR